MSVTCMEAFETSLHKTNVWFREIMDEMHWEDRHRAYLALRAVLHTLRDRLSPQEAAHLGAQLPLLVRGIYYEGWTPTGKPTRERHKEQFLGKISDFFVKEPEVDAEGIARAVFHVLDRHITEGELQDIKHSLPRELLLLWEAKGTA
ncbi:MAG: DUF2267 domain-containing protein [Syntrophotaleaceae bacterium]